MTLPLPYKKKKYNRNSSSWQLLTFCSIESSESSFINETTAVLSTTAILFPFLNLAHNSAYALYNFAPAVMVTDLVMTLMQRDLCDLGSQILIRNLLKERTLKFPIKTNLGLLLNRWLKINRDDSRTVKNSDQQKEGKLSLALPFHCIKIFTY